MLLKLVLVVCLFNSLCLCQSNGPTLWTIGSCSYSPNSPISFGNIDYQYTGKFEIKFNATQDPELKIFAPAAVVADTKQSILYVTAFNESSRIGSYPIQVLLSVNTESERVAFTQYSLQSTESEFMVITWMGFDVDDNRIFALRENEIRHGSSVKVSSYLDVVNPGGAFKQVWGYPGKLTSIYGAINYKQNLLSFPTYLFSVVNNHPVIDDWRFNTIDVVENKQIFSVPIDTTAITSGQSPHNHSIISNMHFDPYSGRYIVAGNLLAGKETVWAGFIDEATGVVTKKFSKELRNPNGDPLIVIYGSAFYEKNGFLTVRVIDADSNNSVHSKLLTLNVRNWGVVAMVPFILKDPLCVDALAYLPS